MENTIKRKEKTRRSNRFEEEKESRLLMQYHRFLSIEDKNWDLLREKLIDMSHKYGCKQALQLCPVCLSLFLSNSLKKHAQISIGSLFLRFNPAEHTSKEVAKIFQEHGRIKIKKNGDILVGFPSFNQVCIPDHSSLQGSIIQYKPDAKREEKSREVAREISTQRMQKRPPKRTERGEVGKKHIKNGVKNNLWKPSLKGGIPPLPSRDPVDLKEMPVKSNIVFEKNE